MRVRSIFRYAYIVPLLVALDRATKLWAAGPLVQRGGQQVALPGLLSFTYVENRGVAFGMFPGMGWAQIAFTCIALAYACILIARKPDMPRTARIALLLMISGALGNVMDRLFYGYVIDFLELLFVRFAVFNIADMCVCAGAVLLAGCALFLKEPLGPQGERGKAV